MLSCRKKTLQAELKTLVYVVYAYRVIMLNYPDGPLKMKEGER